MTFMSKLVDKVLIRNDDEHCMLNLLLFIVQHSKYVQVECVTSCTCRASSRVVSSMLCSLQVQVIESQMNIALYTIVLLGHDGNTMDKSIKGHMTRVDRLVV